MGSFTIRHAGHVYKLEDFKANACWTIFINKKSKCRNSKKCGFIIFNSSHIFYYGSESSLQFSKIIIRVNLNQYFGALTFIPNSYDFFHTNSLLEHILYCLLLRGPLFSYYAKCFNIHWKESSKY